MYLDPKGRDASLLDKKIKEHIAESQSRKQKEGRKKSNTGGSWKQRRFVELHEQIERLVAELPPAKERTEEQKAELQRMVKEKCKMMMQRTGRGLAEEDQHLAPERNERERRRRKEEQEQEADAVAKEAEQEQEQVEVHSKKIESSPAKNEKGKEKVGRPGKNEKRKNTVRILLIYIIFLKPFLLSMLHYCHNMHISN